MRRLKHLDPQPVYRRESELMTVRELAARVHVSPNTISAMLREHGEYLGIRPLRTAPNQLRFPRAAVERVLRGEPAA